MLYIKKVEAEGFKTFNRKVTLNFQPGLIAITGLNGSGKSNIFDAILFALGESSPKTLRVTSLKNLLFDGGVGGEKASKAIVSVQFDNTGREIPVDADTVTFTRELREDGESIFKINGRHVSKQMVINLTQLCLISPEAFNVILQGMINRIAELRPDERRRLLESLVGVAQFDEKKAEALKNLEEATHKLEIAFARIGEIRNVLRKNEEARNILLRYRHIEEEIRHLNAMKVSRNISLLNQQISSLNSSLEEEKGFLKKRMHDKTVLEAEIEALKSQREQFLSSISDPSKTFVNYEMELASTYSKIEEVSSQIKSLEERNLEIEQDLSTLNTMLSGLEVEKGNLSQILERLKNEVKLKETERQSILQKIKTVTAEVNEVNKRLSRIKSKKLKADSKVKKIDILLEKVKAKREKILSIHTKLSYRFKLLESKQNSFSTVLNELKQSLSNLDNLLQTESTEVVSLSKSYEEVERRRRAMLDAIKSSIETLEKVESSIVKAEAVQRIAEELLDLEGLERLISFAKTGAVEGCVGLVKELISFEEKYAKPVKSVCGLWLNAIVVKDRDSLNKLIEAAQKVGAKHFNMITLSEIKPLQLSHPPQEPGIVGYLSSFVNVSSEYDVLKNFLFQSTLLVEDDSIAIKCSSEGFRCVTLDGALYEAYGSGYASGFPEILEAVSSYGVDEYYSELKTVISNLKKIVERRQADLEKLNEKSKTLLEKKAVVSKNLGQVHGEIESLIKFVKKYSETYSSNQLKLNSLRDKLSKIEVYLKRVEERINLLNLKRDALMKIIQSEEENVEAQKLIELNNTLNSLNSQYQSLTNIINEINISLMQTKGRLENDVLVSYNNTRKSIEKLKAEYESNRGKIEEGRRTLVELKEKYESLKAREEEFHQASINMQKTLSDYDTKINEKIAQLNSLNDMISRSTLRINQLTSRIENLREKLESEYNSLRLYGHTSPIEYVEGSDELLLMLQQELDEVKPMLNFLAEKDYESVLEGYKNLSLRSNQLEEERESIIALIEEIDNQKKKVFMEAFEKIDRSLRSIFKDLTDGEAWLELENPEEIFSGGIYLMASFPGKRPKESLMLSGGEKTITTVAFILAMQSAYKSPFYLFDEVDAHLDQLNLERLTNILRERSKEAQIILITLKDLTLSKADKIFGVYQRGGSASIVEYSPGVAVREVKA
ncbi:MAG: chromosome segregation protein SMC [Nitrososphaeria archaeon]|nr:chromosome segregation protein SMC [Nitrososphaeria archaeon]